MKNIKLNNGLEMPILGYGVYQVNQDECEQCVLQAIHCGYRLIDTAQVYGNEAAVGNAISKCGLARQELFITTKIWISNAGYEKAKASIEQSLKNLKTNYIDLLLIHQPFGDYYGTYKAMEEAYKKNQVKAIGVSNFYPDRLIDLCHFAHIKPMINQIETHVFYQQNEAHKIMQKYNVVHQSWGPFAEGKKQFFSNPTLLSIGKKYHKSPAQVALRYLIENNIVVIPKSTHLERMQENFNVFDFKLTNQDKIDIAQLDEKISAFFSHQDPATVEMFVNMIK